jgi:hypothetical protein
MNQSKLKMIRWCKKHPNQIPIIEEQKDGSYIIKK